MYVHPRRRCHRENGSTPPLFIALAIRHRAPYADRTLPCSEGRRVQQEIGLLQTKKSKVAGKRFRARQAKSRRMQLTPLPGEKSIQSSRSSPALYNASNFYLSRRYILTAFLKGGNKVPVLFFTASIRCFRNGQSWPKIFHSNGIFPSPLECSLHVFKINQS